MIKKLASGKYELRSKDGKKKLGGPFDTRAKAEAREREIRGFADRSMVNVNLSITKASVLQDGTMRFQATCSDIEEDSRGEQTTLSLFNDWIDRVEKGQSVDWLPEPKMPFLGIAHYPALEGKGEAGVIEKMYVDGNQLKVTGYFHNDESHPCGQVAFSAIQTERELTQKGESIDNPLQISAAWWDLQHSHGKFNFTRKSVDDKCPICPVRAEDQPRKFLKGHPDHMAITRHPVHPRTSISLEERSDGQTITRQQDAASILNDELAQMLEDLTKPTEKSEPVSVVLSEHLNEENGTSHLGPISFEEVDEIIEAAETQAEVRSNFSTFMFITDNIMNRDDQDFDKIAAMKQALSDFDARISVLQSEATDTLMLSNAQIGGVQMSDKEEVQEDMSISHPVDALRQSYDKAFAKDSQLSRIEGLEGIQAALTEFATLAQTQADVVNPVSRSEQLSEAVLAELRLISARLAVQQPVVNTQPTQRSLSPGQQIVNPAQPIQQQPPAKKETQIERLARQTVMAR